MQRPIENISENKFELLDKTVLEMMQAAVKNAYRDALSSGGSVLISENAEIIEVFPDGSRKFVQKIEPRIKIKKGTIIKIK